MVDFQEKPPKSLEVKGYKNLTDEFVRRGYLSRPQEVPLYSEKAQQWTPVSIPHVREFSDLFIVTNTRDHIEVNVGDVPMTRHAGELIVFVLQRKTPKEDSVESVDDIYVVPFRPNRSTEHGKSMIVSFPKVPKGEDLSEIGIQFPISIIPIEAFKDESWKGIFKKSRNELKDTPEVKEAWEIFFEVNREKAPKYVLDALKETDPIYYSA